MASVCGMLTTQPHMQEQHRLVGPGEEASLNFWFQTDQTFPAREFQASPGRLHQPRHRVESPEL